MRGELDFLPVLRRFASQAEIYAVSPIEHSLTGDLTLYRLTAESLSDPSSKGRDAAKAILKQGRTIELSTLDSVGVVLVPGLAFDRTGARLGRGGGFYDRLLARPEFLLAQKIAVCLQMQILDSVPIEPHDAHVDIIVTETEIHRIRTLSS
jgi:5,10-methenyltetrahydrofolate synthetase